MKYLSLIVLLLVSLAHPLSAASAQTTAAPPKTHYSLPPAKLAKAQALSHDFAAIHFAYAGWSILSLGLMLSLGAIRHMRDAALRLTPHIWLQGPVFLALLMLARTTLNLPLAILAHHLAVGFGLSVQSWLSWTGDLAKSFALTWAVGSLLAVVLFACIRRWPQRWWLAFWAALVPIVFVAAFLMPVLIDPLFDHFTPLQQVNPALATELERVVQRAHVDIPLSQMSVMQASDKYTGLNAYVTGLGSSKRVVVWDTTIAKAPVEVIQMIFAHEVGHYVLGHVLLGTSLALAGLLAFFYLARLILLWLLSRYGQRWAIPSQQDCGALAVLILLLSTASFLSEPLSNGISRQIEHTADVYGQEAMHGLVPDPQVTAVESFQILGEASLDDPAPNPFVVFWIYNHPSTTQRANFAAQYDPWAPNQQPKYFPK